MNYKEDTVYALELKLTKDTLGKLGFTNKPIEKRITGFRFTGTLRGLENDIQKVFISKSLIAKAVEDVAHQIAKKRGYKSVDNANLGNGRSEWYFATGQQLKSCILQAYAVIKKDLVRNAKQLKRDIKRGDSC